MLEILQLILLNRLLNNLLFFNKRVNSLRLRILVLENMIEVMRILFTFSLQSFKIYIHVPVTLNHHCLVHSLLSLLHYFFDFLLFCFFCLLAEIMVFNKLLVLYYYWIFGVHQILLLLFKHAELFILLFFIFFFLKSYAFCVVISHVQWV